MRRIGIISGVPEELDAFRPDLPGDPMLVGRMPVRSVVHADKQVLLACEGIGKVAAATAATLLVALGEVELLLVLGTAGKLGAIDGHLFQIGDAIQSDYGAMRTEGFAHFSAGEIPFGTPRVDAFAADVPIDLGLPRARIATGDMFVESPAHAARLHLALGADLVDMETAAVAHAAVLLGVPWCAIKATTDGADDASAATFSANLAAAARHAAEAAEELIRRL